MFFAYKDDKPRATIETGMKKNLSDQTSHGTRKSPDTGFDPRTFYEDLKRTDYRITKQKEDGSFEVLLEHKPGQNLWRAEDEEPGEGVGKEEDEWLQQDGQAEEKKKNAMTFLTLCSSELNLSDDDSKALRDYLRGYCHQGGFSMMGRREVAKFLHESFIDRMPEPYLAFHTNAGFYELRKNKDGSLTCIEKFTASAKGEGIMTALADGTVVSRISVEGGKIAHELEKFELRPKQAANKRVDASLNEKSSMHQAAWKQIISKVQQTLKEFLRWFTSHFNSHKKKKETGDEEVPRGFSP